MKAGRALLAAAALILAPAQGAWAWGPHPAITKAALAVLPEKERWNGALGEANVSALTHYCWMPDQAGEDLGSFYADDYLLFRAQPRYPAHGMPGVRATYRPYFLRALQALRTETPANACRQIGPLVHLVEDTGAPPHAKAGCPNHGEMENWVDAEQIAIPGYQAKLLGRTDEEALQGLVQRMEALVAFSIERADRALPLVQAAQPDRAKVEPILLESALECSRAVADLLYTLFTLGLAPQPEGATLEGDVTAGEIPLRNDHGARIVLLGTDFTTLAISSPPQTSPATGGAGSGWRGAYRFHHLPAGTYQVLAYRTASRARILGPVTLAAGKTARLDIALPPTDPPGNLVENPDGTLAYLQEGAPDRWQRVRLDGKPAWRSAAARVNPGVPYRLGAVLKDPAAKVGFRFLLKLMKREVLPSLVELPAGQTNPAEARFTPNMLHSAVQVFIETEKPLTEVIERVWVVPEAK